MVDSVIVLYGQTIAYSAYCIVMILLVGWFAYRVTRGEQGKLMKSGYFYGFVAFLTVLGVSLHIITYNTIPWSPMDLNRESIKPDKVYEIKVSNHKFSVPESPMVVKVNQKVVFNVSSDDLTYGFGLFRKDNSMLFQMQVIPWHKNDIMWQFNKPGIYSIRSTEYSGPKGDDMVVTDAVQVVQ